ncbi:MAG: DUF2520 domain-containing protein [Candidatus Kapabacteria bacterium]|jgi:predicted short-subunit dehydrogenase-like oxidoreductase (DUF2520 family)|nr:DUF2520 domain-containing protein [Candidatus Kapabacteria bacterium]
MNKTFGIIGAGKLGNALVRFFHENGLDTFVITKPEKNHEEFHNIGIKALHDVFRIDTFPDFLFLTVRDNQILNLASELAEKSGDKLSDTICIHCSGVFDSNILKPIENHAKAIVKLHPFQTFYRYNQDIFDGIAWISESAPDFKEEIRSLVNNMNGKVYFVDEISNFNPQLYHVAAVFASNYLVPTIRYAYKTAEKSGIAPDEFIPNISRTALNNSFDLDDLPLTGPIARFDVETINKHISSLKSHPSELKAYLLFALGTAELSLIEYKIDRESYELLKNLLLSEINDLYSNS